MVRLPLLLGLFLSVTMAGIVFLLSCIAKVTLGTLLFRAIVTFFLFGFLGVALGSVLEVFVLPAAAEQETRKVRDEASLMDPELENELGDLLTRVESSATGIEKPDQGFRPVVFPRMTVQNDKVIGRGDTTVIS